MPIEDTVGAIAELVQAGYVRHIGLSEAVRELGIAVTAYGVLSKGLLTGGFRPGEQRDGRDFRTSFSLRF